MLASRVSLLLRTAYKPDPSPSFGTLMSRVPESVAVGKVGRASRCASKRRRGEGRGEG